MSYGYIYKTTNLINGRLYIGQKQGTFTPQYLGSGKIIECAIKKYGKHNFRLEVLAFATTKPMLDGLEMKFIFEYRQVFGRDFIYNITDGGEGMSGYKHSEKSKEKNREKHLGLYAGENNPFYGKKHNSETLAKLSLKLKDGFANGRIHNNKGKTKNNCERLRLQGIKQSLKTKGRKSSPEAIAKRAIGIKLAWARRKANGTDKTSLETRKKQSESRKGKEPWNKGKHGVYSEETLLKMSKAKKGALHGT